jgi:hypothetical protein
LQRIALTIDHERHARVGENVLVCTARREISNGAPSTAVATLTSEQ